MPYVWVVWTAVVSGYLKVIVPRPGIKDSRNFAVMTLAVDF
jgi:hypothetical protein